MAGELASQFTPILYALGIGVMAGIPSLILSRLLSPRKRYNPVKFLPMECGQMPTGEGRSHFMMQYYAYILMFVVFDVMSIFLYAWGASLLVYPKRSYFTYDGLSCYNVCIHGLCLVSLWKERNMVMEMRSLIELNYHCCIFNYKGSRC